MIVISGVVFQALHNLVDGRCYKSKFKQEERAPKWPAIRYTITDSLPEADICGTDLGETDETRVQIDCVALSPGAVEILRDQVLVAMQDVYPPCTREGMFETFDSETKTDRIIIEYSFHPSSQATS